MCERKEKRVRCLGKKERKICDKEGRKLLR
jgi:hypothetical protein